MDTPASKKLDIIIPAYRMHSQSFVNVLEGISEEQALKRIDDKTNHVIWMAGNFVNMRYSLGGLFGIKEEDPYNDLFSQGKAWNESYTYPTLKEIRDNFHQISPLVYKRLLKTTDEELGESFKMGMDIPFVPEDKLNFVGMCIGREDYLCGQIGLMRKLLGYEGMKYNLNENLNY
ncbi:MAG TPA: hypothetical protein VL098_06640 [Flavipsychrobacter sp.]|nr:hypothetical protein [Flavipsychrobacter sp.]